MKYTTTQSLPKFKIRIVLLLVAFIFLSSPSKILGQYSPNNIVIPPSPTASSVVKFIESPVGLYTGTPNVSIPLYQFNSKSISLPISLSYHAGGHKVDEVSGWTGLGWSLSTNYVITRTIRGLPDEHPWGYSNNPILDDFEDEILDVYEYPDIVKRMAVGEYDGEPDLYHFSFPGGSGKFVIDRRGESPKFLIQPYQDLKIEQPDLGSFIITTSDGTQYTFNQTETTLSSSVNTTNSQSPCEPDVLGVNDVAHTTGWYLKTIQAPNNMDRVTFNYVPYHAVYYAGLSATSYLDNTGPLFSTSYCTTAPFDSECVSKLRVEGVRLTSITNSIGGGVRFGVDESETRKDLKSGGVRLDDIVIYNGSNTLRSFKLNYFYSTADDAPIISDNSLKKRLKLKGVTEFGANGESKPPFVLHYLGETENRFKLPSRLSYDQDHWGFYNNAGNENFIPKRILPGFPRENERSDRNTNQLAVYSGMLSKIDFPTGGYNSFEYEANGWGNFNTNTLRTYSSDQDFTPVSHTISAHQIGNGSPIVDEKTFTIPYDLYVNYTVTTYNDQGFEWNGFVKFTDEEGNSLCQNNPFPCASNTPEGTNIYSVLLEAGTYTISASAVTNGDFAEIIIEWEEMDLSDIAVDNIFEIHAGGVRVKKQIISTGEGTDNDQVFNYDYSRKDNPLKSSGRIITLPRYDFRFRTYTSSTPTSPTGGPNSYGANSYEVFYSVWMLTNGFLHNVSEGTSLGASASINCSQAQCTFLGLTSSSKVALGSSQGSHLVYENVTVTKGENKEDGKSEYLYSMASDEGGSGFPYSPQTSYDWKRGLLLEQVDYKGTEGNYEEIQRTTNRYNFREDNTLNSDRLIGLVVALKTQGQLCLIPPFVTCVEFESQNGSGVSYSPPGCETDPAGTEYNNLAFAEQFAYRSYSFYSHWINLESSTTTKDGVSVTKSYTYDETYGNHTNPLSVSFNNSDGRVHRTEMLYPHDFPDDAIATQMASQYMISTPLITTNLVSGSIVGGTEMKMMNSNGKLLPWKIFQTLPNGSQRLMTTISYFPNGYPEAQFPYNGQNETYTWAANGGMASRTLLDDWTWTYNWNSSIWQVGSIEDIDGLSVSYKYDGFQRLEESTVHGEGQGINEFKSKTTNVYKIGSINKITSTTSFSSNGTTSQVPDQVSEQIFDGLGRLKTAVSNGILTEDLTYDNLGRIAQKLYLPGSYTELSYEPSPLNRAITQIFPDQSTVGTEYGGGGQYHQVAVTDENGNTSISKTDILGRSSEMIDALGNTTRYEYDNRGNIATVLPPNFEETNERYIYTYDNFNRLISKVIPSGGTHQFRYNSKDQLVASQTGNEWIGTKYDIYGRPTQTGKTSGAPNPQNVNFSELLTETFYDDYDNVSSFPNLSLSPGGNNTTVKGKVVGTKVKVLGTNDWIYTTTAYDEFGRSTKTNSSNLLSGNDFVKSILNLADLPETITRTHNTSLDNQTITEDFTYDALLRPYIHRHDIEGADQVLLSLSTFNGNNQVTSKKIGQATGISGFLQEINYKYNNRGWLTHINDVDMVGQEVNLPDCNDPPTPCGEKCDFSVTFAFQNNDAVINIIYGQVDPTTGTYNPMSAGLDYPYIPNINGDLIRLENDLIAWMFAEGIPNDGVGIVLDKGSYTLTIYKTDAKFQTLQTFANGLNIISFTDSCKPKLPEICDFTVEYEDYEASRLAGIGFDGTYVEFDKKYASNAPDFVLLKANIERILDSRKIPYREVYADSKSKKISIFQTSANFEFVLNNYKGKYDFVKSNCQGGEDNPTEVCKDGGYELDRCPETKTDEPCAKCSGDDSETCENCKFKAKFIRPTSIKVEYNHPALLKGDLSSKANLLRVTETSYRTLANDQVLFTHKTQNTAIGKGVVVKSALTHVMEIKLEHQWITEVTLETVKNNVRQLLTTQLTNAGIKQPELQVAFANAVVDLAANDWTGTSASLDDIGGGAGQGSNTPTIANPDMFSMQLLYADGHDMVNSSIQKNGNISGMVWKTPGRNTQSYSFEYDEINRLKEAHHQDVTAGGQLSTNNKYGMEVTYDKVGNINTLNRRGVIDICTKPTTSFEYGPMDGLAYNYVSGGKPTNRLQSIKEFANTDHGFRTEGGNYSYDGFGNMTTDPKSGATIQYNHLNLPKSITFAGGGSITFTYDAAGIKLKKQVSSGPGTDGYTIYYIGGIEYRDGELESIHHAEGRITFQEEEPLYEYFLKDHLGNVRVTIADKDGDGYIEPFNVNPNQPNPGNGASIDLTDTEVYQETHYYPFGMTMEGEWQDIVHGAENKYLYNGKELNSDFGLDWSDYGARYYDASIARWNAVDPLAEAYQAYSTYNYTLNNPIRFIDPDGRSVEDYYVFDEKGKYLRTEDNDAPDQLVIENSTTGDRSYHAFNDPEHDVKMLRDMIPFSECCLNKMVYFVSQENIDWLMTRSKVQEKNNYFTRLGFTIKESFGGALDFTVQLSHLPIDDRGSGLGTVWNPSRLWQGGETNRGEKWSPFFIFEESDRVAYNWMDTGNWLWGNAQLRMGDTSGKNAGNLPSMYNLWDTKADQEAVMDGWHYRYGWRFSSSRDPIR